MKVRLRMAAAGDSERLFDWVNRPDSLAAKLRTTGPIPRERHEEWFRRALGAPGVRIWIAEHGRRSLGQVRMTRAEQGWEADIYVESEYRRRGAALSALRAAIAALRREFGPVPVIARIRHANPASHALFESAGFGLKCTLDDHIVYVLPAGRRKGESEGGEDAC